MQFWGFALLCLAAFAYFEGSHLYASGQDDIEPEERSATVDPEPLRMPPDDQRSMPPHGTSPDDRSATDDPRLLRRSTDDPRSAPPHKTSTYGNYERH